MINIHSDQNDKRDKLVDISQVKSYKDIFVSFQWAQAFLCIYNPENIQCITCKHVSVCYCLDKNMNMVAVGDPFNDFNAICNCSQFADSIEIISQEYNVSISNSYLLLSGKNTSKTNCYKTCLKNYEVKVSSRLYNQYVETEKKVVYHQISVSDPTFMENLSWLLKNRQNHLMENKTAELNNSFQDEFNDFIVKFCTLSSHSNAIQLEILKSVNSGAILAMNLNFYAPDGVMCYLRACSRGISKTISYGLVLDVYSMSNAKHNKYPVYDLTRGDEPYKLRLGADKYTVYNQVISAS